MYAMSESLEPGSQAIFTHSPWRGLAASRAGACRLLGGSLGSPWFELIPATGGARSPADMCAMCSSAGSWRWQAHRTPATAQVATALRSDDMDTPVSWREREPLSSALDV